MEFPSWVPYVMFGMLALASIFNALTKHFSQQSGVFKWLTALSEVFSVVVSMGESVGAGPMKKLKLPGQSVVKEVKKDA